MPICEIHNTFYYSDQMCGGCWREEQIKKQAERKAEKAFQKGQKFKKFEVSEKTKKRNALKVKLQLLWSRYMKIIYKEKGVYYDWISGKTNNQTGLFSLHVSHYHSKGEIWQLWCDPINSGLSEYNYNVNKPETVPLMRKKMIEVWGEKEVNDLDQRAENYRSRIQMGIDSRYPDDIWLMGMIQEMQRKLIKIYTNIDTPDLYK